ncbi:RraA family protein [Planosporangium mesophilum]|uniref:Putative 4-hydroxy-4-methyl-2-oxoglutarate aldolase n=1 Tax=Planosporangium mesophilum TaxID=689768 RepID=A0A8J3TGG3_9ACTN|nr:dimethylmenaquinone methyltransferase [Planosporangium mesophilum]GII25076.1 4-carboxy-4-hydroxy-2-oxoadipate aldolase [Planosporangium mesophilum]
MTSVDNRAGAAADRGGAGASSFTGDADASVSGRAARQGAATLHEAAGRIGALPSRFRPVDPALRLAGPAFPVLCPVGDNLWLHRAIYAASPGDVLVVQTGLGEEYGYWGEITTVAAQERGLAGLVIDGGVRDCERISDLGFPVFSAVRSIRGTLKDHTRPGALGAPVLLGDVLVRRGDLVVGDADGVVALPADRVEEVLAAGEERERKEADVLARLRAGESTLDIYGWRGSGDE